MSAKAIERELRKIGSREKAASSAWFFKTGKGQYGEGDVFLGVTVPEQRSLAQGYIDLSFLETTTLLKSKIHECRLTALIILVGQSKKGDESYRNKIVKFYLAHTRYINNWDLVDVSASYILGSHLLNKERAVLYSLVKSKNIWERRIAIVATHALIRAGNFGDTLALSEILLTDKEDLMHKAVGWMLREVGKKDRPTLVKFLKANAHHMPRTALRYSIEHFSDLERKKFMQMKRPAKR